MGRVIWAIKDIIISLIFLIPLFLLWIKLGFLTARHSLPYLLYALYLVAIYSLVGLPDILYLRFDFKHNFIPFLGMMDSLEETLLNVLLFLPLGFFLPVLCQKYQTIKYTLLFGFTITLGIEFLQIFTFRSTDINDLITNLIGTLLGFFVAKIITGNFQRMTLNISKPQKIYLISATVFGVMFLLVPFMKPILSVEF